jgi:hypothetical protein
MIARPLVSTADLCAWIWPRGAIACNRGRRRPCPSWWWPRPAVAVAAAGRCLTVGMLDDRRRMPVWVRLGATAGAASTPLAPRLEPRQPVGRGSSFQWPMRGPRRAAIIERAISEGWNAAPTHVSHAGIMPTIATA